MAAGARVDGADVQAGAAADAVQRLAAHLVGEHPGTAGVEQDDVELLRARLLRPHPSRARCRGSSARPWRSEGGAAGRPRGRRRWAGASRSRGRSPARAEASCTCARCLRTRQRRRFRSRRCRSWRRSLPSARSGTSRAGRPGLPRRARAGSSEIELSAIVRRKRSRISVRLRWIAGTRMCEGQSPSSWRISSAKSVSIASTPPAASASLRPISSVVSDFTFTTSVTPCARATLSTAAFASAASRAQCTVAPAATSASSNCSRYSSRRASTPALIALPASRSSSQSGSSPTARARLSRMVVVARSRFARC